MPTIEPRAQMLADLRACLPAFGIRLAGTAFGGTDVVVRGYPHHDVWLITDNGGELNVEKINHPDSLRSVAYAWWGTLLDGATMAYRVACVLRGDAIDYDFRLADILDELKAAA